MMKEALFYSFLVIFVATAIVTLLGLTGHLKIRPGFLKALVTSLLLELAVSVIALYRTTDFFDGTRFERYVKPNQQEYIWKEAKIRFSYPRTGWSLDTKRMQGGLGDLALVAGNASLHKYNSTTALLIHSMSTGGIYFCKRRKINGRVRLRLLGQYQLMTSMWTGSRAFA